MACAPAKLIFGRPLQLHSSWTLFEGFHIPTSQPVLLKHCLFHKHSQLAESLTELCHLAQLRHACSFSLIDLVIAEKEAGLELVVCVEKLEKDLQREIMEKVRGKQRYREEELWRFLWKIVKALAYAQQQVSAM